MRARLSLDVIRVARRDLRGNADNLEYSVAAESLSGIFISAERLQCGHDSPIVCPAGRPEGSGRDLLTAGAAGDLFESDQEVAF